MVELYKYIHTTVKCPNFYGYICENVNFNRKQIKTYNAQVLIVGSHYSCFYTSKIKSAYVGIGHTSLSTIISNLSTGILSDFIAVVTLSR